jgi:hypothetical protein
VNFCGNIIFRNVQKTKGVERKSKKARAGAKTGTVLFSGTGSGSGTFTDFGKGKV